ncbi:MAG: T9SS type A sorting domain-containing protein [Bacteroidales bacterium]
MQVSRCNNNPVIIDTITLASNLAVSDSALFQFTKATNLNNPGIYSVKVWTMNEPDPLFYHAQPNDTATKQIEVFPLPTIGLRDTIRSSRPDTLTLTAHPDVNYNYYWLFNGSTSNSLHIPGKGKFIIRVTDTRGLGCQTYDTTLVEKLVLDVGVDSVLNPNNACELGSAVHPALRIRNYGSDTLAVGDTIPVSFKLDAGPLVKRNYKLSQRLFPQATTIFTFADTTVDMSGIKTYSLSFATYFKYDSTAANNSLGKTVEVYGYPSVYIGPDTLIAGLTYLLDPGPGYKSYLWNNGDTTQTYLARFIGNHWVTITDEHDCPASDTAFIHLVIHDIGIAEVIQPLSACNPAGMQRITVVVENMGTDTLTAGLEVPIGYSLKGNAWVRDTVILPGDLYPNAQVLNTFDAIEDFSTLGDYDLEVFAHILADINPANDTLADTVSYWGNPFVNLGTDGVYKKISHTLDAGAGENLTYNWSTGDTAQTITISNTGNYWVTITDTLHGCTDRDTILITLLIDDMGVLAHAPDTVFCKDAFTGIGLTLKNFGNLNYTVNKKIPVMYRLNGGSLRGDTAVVGSLLVPGGTLNFTIDNFLSVPPVGENTLVTYTKLTGDLRSENDTLTIRFFVNENPTIDLGGGLDTIHYATIPYQLDAGAGYSAYSWNTGSNGQFVNISSDGWYRVTVTDGGGCTASDSVFMYFFNSIGYKEGAMGKYKFFPNPAGDFLRMQVETKEGEITILEMVNPLGQVVFNRSITGGQRYDGVVDTRQFSRGIYLMRLRNSQGSRMEKIILE